MQIKPLVSVITPAYNTGKYISNLLESILSQSYPNIEMYVVDDGSTDDTGDVVNSFIPRFHSKGYSLNYIYQENSGQSVAINRALKLIKGRYLVWPDSDDYYNSENAIERMVQEFERNNGNVGIVRTQERIIKDTPGQIIQIGINGENSKPYYKAHEIFENCLYGNDFYFCSGAYMIDFDLFKKCNGLEIYTEKNAGQNWQMMLPMLYHYDCVTIMEPLYNVVERLNSHSRGQYKGYESEKAKINSYLNTIISTLERMDMPEYERNHYINSITETYNKSFFIKAFCYSNIEEGIFYYKRLSSNDKKSPKLLLMQLLLRLRLSKFVYNLYNKLGKF